MEHTYSPRTWKPEAEGLQFQASKSKKFERPQLQEKYRLTQAKT
jgi:hypothetical protein